MQDLGPRARAIVAALILVIGAGVLAVSVDLDDSTDQQGHHHRSITVKLGGAQKLDPSAPAQTVTLTPPAQAVAGVQKAQDAAGNDEAAHSDLRAEPPAALRPSTIEANHDVAPAGQPTPPATIPLATVNTPGCRTLLVRNQSARTGAPSLLIVLHATVSADAGLAGVLGNVRWFDTPAAQASSNYIVARTAGQCAYTVPESAKAWAQAGFNSVTPCSIEVTARLTEGSYLPPGSAGRARVIGLIRGCARRWHIPLQHGRVSGCRVVRPGVVEHADLGACGGGHVDVNPYSIDDLIAQARAGARRPGPPAAVVTDCRHVAKWRARYPRGRGSSSSSRAHTRAHLAHAKRAGYACPVGSSKPHKA